MNGRQVLVIACNDKQRQLGFIPDLPNTFFSVMTDPNIGNCGGYSSHPLIDPTSEQIRVALKDAYKLAAEERDHLILYLLGHGVRGGESNTYYFGESSESGFDLASEIKRFLDFPSKPPSLALILDTCHSGSGTIQTATVCNGLTQFATLAAVTAGLTYNGDFTRALIDLMKDESHDGGAGTISLEFAADYAAEKLKDRERTHYSHGKQGGRAIPYLARNLNYNGLGGRVLPPAFQETAALRQIEDGLRQVNVVHVTGPFGSGKSTLAVALTGLHGPRGTKNSGFIHATVFLTPNTTIGILADQLCEQLSTACGPFRDSLQRLHTPPVRELEAKNPLLTQVLQPLEGMRGNSNVRILIDGYGEPFGAGEAEIRTFLRDLSQMPRVRLVVFGEPGHSLPGAGARPIDLTLADENDLAGLLLARGISGEATRRSILQKGRRNWRLTALLAALAANGEITEAKLSQGVNEYSRLLLERLEDSTIQWRSHMAPVLGVLALAGKGPILPIELLVTASAKLGGPATRAGVQLVLDRLGELVERSEAGRDTELAGVAIADLTEYLFRDATGVYLLDRTSYEMALVDSIEELAPRKASWRGRVGTYAWRREAEHLSHLKHVSLLDSLRLRESRYVTEDRDRWQYWMGVFAGKDGKEGDYSVYFLFAAFQVLRLELEILLRQPKGASGQEPAIEQRERDLEEAYSKLTRVHRSSRAALWAGVDWCVRVAASSSWKAALALCRQLENDARSLLPEDDIVRQELECYLLVYRKEANAPTEDTSKLLRELEIFINRVEKSAGPKSLIYLDLRVFQAGLIGETDPDRALGILQEVLLLQRTLTGDDDASVLTTRHNIVAHRKRSKQAGQLQTAFAEADKLVEDQIRYFGKGHFDSIQTRLLGATLGFEHGFRDASESLAALDELLADARMAFEPGHEFLTRIEAWKAAASVETDPGEPARAECARCLQNVREANIISPSLVARLEAAAGSKPITGAAGA